MSRRDREDPRIVRTRQLIVRAFQELLGEKDFEALTIQEIADRATINRVTFYAHFEDKYVLLEAAFNQSFASELCAIVSPTAEFNRSNLQLLIETVCVFLEKAYAHCAPSGRAHVEAGLGRQLQQQLYAFVLTWLKQTESDQDAAELQATVASWAIYGVAKRWNEGKRKETVRNFARQALPMIAASFDLRAEAGILK
jgi:AcrR family transcriptional regulator